jgi:hypothetical protein
VIWPARPALLALKSSEKSTDPLGSHQALPHHVFPFVQRCLTLIRTPLARVSPPFSLVSAALPLVGEVFSVSGRAVYGLGFASRAPCLTVSPPRNPGRDLGSVMETQLSSDPLQVALYGALRDEEARGYRTVGQAFSDQTSHLSLSRG